VRAGYEHAINYEIPRYPEISRDKTKIRRISRDNPTWWISWDISIIFCICRVMQGYPYKIARVAFPTEKSDTSYLGGIRGEDPTYAKNS